MSEEELLQRSVACMGEEEEETSDESEETSEEESDPSTDTGNVTPSVMHTANEWDEELLNSVREHLISNGQMPRLKDFAERRLSECGWKLDMVAICRELLRDTKGVTFEMLYEKLKNSEKVLSDNIRNDIVRRIKHCYESDCESKS